MQTSRCRRVALVLLALFAACGKPGPVGVYEVDKKALREVLLAAYAKMPDMAAQVDDLVASTGTTVELKADGSVELRTLMTMMGQTVDRTSQGTWKLDGATLTIAMKTGDKDDVKTAEFDGKSFAIEDTAGDRKMKLTYRRR